MGDSIRNGNIAWFHNLRAPARSAGLRDRGLPPVARAIGLILPSLHSELKGETLPAILDEPAKVPSRHRIIIGLDRADEAEFRAARTCFARLPQAHVVPKNDSTRTEEIGARLEAMGPAPQAPGKGKGVWTAIGYLVACADSAGMAIHLCEILTCSQEMPARLVCPVAHPGFS